MIIIGLTGGIASGKSTVARMLKEKGAAILDADRIAREVVEPGKPAWREIVCWLGEGILMPDRTLDRERLGRLVFNDENARNRFNSIIHPRVGREFQYRTAQIRDGHRYKVLVYDVPLLIETGMHRSVDLVLLVYSTPEMQLKRLCERDNLTAGEALARLQAQLPLEQKKEYADAIIDNNGTVENTRRQVDRFWSEIERRSR